MSGRLRRVGLESALGLVFVAACASGGPAPGGVADSGSADGPAVLDADLALADAGAAPDAVVDTADTALPAIDALAADAPADAPADSTACSGKAGCACAADADCDDDDPCTYGQECAVAACTAGVALLCDDGNPCTDDICAAAVGCKSMPNAVPCFDGDVCTGADVCKAGACAPGKPKVCSDGNECTDDVCDTALGCVFAANGAPCFAGNACQEAAVCAYGSCPAGKAKPCDDGNACTVEWCDGTTGCTSKAKPAAGPCTGPVAFGRCWHAAKQNGTWSQARAACQSWGGELASVRWADENDHVRALADATVGKGTSVWIGFSDAGVEGNWRWTDGSTTTFWGFGPGEPNNAGGEDVAELTGNGVWNDIGATERPGFVCSRDVSPTCDDGSLCQVGATCQGATCLATTATVSCDDGNPCSIDSCQPGAGCVSVPLPLLVTATCAGGSAGPATWDGTCWEGVCALPPGASETTLPASCAALHLAKPQLPTGLHWLDADGKGPAAPYQAMCEMVQDGGGWTLVLRVNGNDPAAAYGSSLWTAALPVEPTVTGLPDSTHKNQGFWTIPATQLRVGLRMPANGKDKTPPLLTGWVTLPLPPTVTTAATLQARFATGKPTPSTLGVSGWKKLWAGSSLQAWCHPEGLNVTAPNGAAVRIGTLGNNEPDCGSVDSWLGLGGTPNICGVKDKPTVGNVACWGPDQGDRAVAGTGFVFVR
ncbi:MAG: hypothetical protein EXR79_06190 [Myxococcales bacterium]|nr:hypothetical protein [Myxococcales bacterium]